MRARLIFTRKFQRHDAYAQTSSHADNGADNAGILVIRSEIAHKRLVNL
jgi:hypothetical protein